MRKSTDNDILSLHSKREHVVDLYIRESIVPWGLLGREVITEAVQYSLSYKREYCMELRITFYILLLSYITFYDMP
jgi:hypothetical protein